MRGPLESAARTVHTRRVALSTSPLHATVGRTPTANEGGMAHPLFDDPDRLEQVMRLAYLKILRVLRLYRTSSAVGELPGGVSADDILQEVLMALWEFDPDELRSSWEALAVTIARNKTVDALRRAGGGTESLDHPTGPDGEEGPLGVEKLADGRSAEDEVVAMEDEGRLWQLAREHLDERELRIFYDIHYLGRTRGEVGRELGLTGQRVGQIYARILIRLWELIRTSLRFSHRRDHDADGNEAGPGDDQGDDEVDGEEGEA